jgi:hypothetical protein
MKENILVIILVLLVFLASASDFYGHNIPKFVWRLSLVAAGAIGFVAGTLLAPFPENLLIGSFISIGSIISFLVSRAIRNEHQR